MGKYIDAVISSESIDPTEDRPTIKPGSALEAVILGKQDYPGLGIPKKQIQTGEEQLTVPIYRGYQEKGTISTITGKPEVVPGGAERPETADFYTLFKTGFVDDPQTQIKIFAKTRFPDIPQGEARARYGVTEDGIIVFRDDDGIYKTETAHTFVDQAKALAARTGASSASIVLGALGLAVGPFTGVAGAAGGELIRKLVGKYVFDEPSDALDIAIDVGAEGLLGLIGVGSGKIFTKATNASLNAAKINKSEMDKLAKLATKDLKFATPRELAEARMGPLGIVSPIKDPAEMVRLQAIAEKYGIDLNVAEIAGNRELLNRFNLLADLDQSADLIQEWKKTQNLQIQNAIPRFLDTISEEADPFEVGIEIAKAANDAVIGLKDIRKVSARPFYKQAFADTERQIDISPVIKYIDDKLPTSKGSVRNNLLKAKQLLQKPKTTKPAGKLVTPEGKPLVPSKTEFDTSVKSLHDVKIELDEIISTAKQSGLGNTVRGNYKQIRRLLLEQMDEQSPLYATARVVHGLHSTPIEQVEKGLIGILARMEGDNVVGAATQILASKNSTPQLVKRAKFLIESQKPEAWQAAKREFLRFRFERIKDSQISDVSNIGGAFRKAVFGDENQRKILKAAMTPEEFQNLSDFMEVLQRTGLTFAKESTTATRQEALKAFHRETRSEALELVGSPLQAHKKGIIDRIQALRFGRGARQLTEVFLDPNTKIEITKMKRLSPKSEELIQRLSFFLAITSPETTEFIGDVGKKETQYRTNQ